MIPKDFDLRRPAGARLSRRPRTGDVKGLRIGIPKEYRIDGMAAEIDELWAEGTAWLKAAGAEIVDISPAAYQIRAADLLHHRPGRGLVEPRAL